MVKSLILVDRECQFIKSQAGAGATLAETRQIPRAALPCSYVIAGNETLVVDDLARDRRFAGSPLARERGLRFYAGVPLHAPNGQPIGTLSILDGAPRQLTAREKRLLRGIRLRDSGRDRPSPAGAHVHGGCVGVC